VSRWHLWLGSGIKRPRCEVCGIRRFVFRYTNGELDALVCLRHRGAIPGMPER
jgi:hypothetical protein